MNDLDALAQRLNQLEQEARWWRRVAAVPLLLAAAVGLLGQSAPRSTRPEAESCVVRDAEGNVRAQLRILPGGQVGLVFLDGENHARLHLTMNPDDSTSLQMFDGATAQRLTMRVDGEASRFSLSTPDQGRALFLFVTQKTSTGLALNRAKAPRTYPIARGDGQSDMRVRGTDGKAIWKAP